MADYTLGLFIGVESFSWQLTDFDKYIAFARANGVNQAVVKIYEITQGEWYSGLGGADVVIKHLQAAGLDVLPYGFFYGTDAVTEANMTLKYLQAYGKFCMNLESSLDGNSSIAQSFANLLKNHPGDLYISTWANPETHQWTQNITALDNIVQVWMPEAYDDTLLKEMYSQFPKVIGKIQPTFHVFQTSPILARPYPFMTLWEYQDALKYPNLLEQYSQQAQGYTMATYPTNSRGMVQNMEGVTEFQPNHSEFECGAFSVALNAFATNYNQPGRTDTGNLINWAEAEYAKTAGDNSPSNTAGASIDDMHTYLLDTQKGGVPNALHFWDTTISGSSTQSHDIETIKQALAHGYPVIATVTESSVFDLDLGKNPYWWGPTGNHILTWVGVAPDGNLLAFDEANVIQGDGNLQTPKSLQPQPRRYDISRIANLWATIVKQPWLPAIPNNDPLSWPAYQPTPTSPFIVKEAQDVWPSVDASIPPGTDVYAAWLLAYTTQKFNFGPPVTHEIHTVDPNGNVLIIQYFATGFRAEWAAGHTNFKDALGRIVFSK